MTPSHRVLVWFLIIALLPACGVFKVVKPDEAPGAKLANMGFDHGEGRTPATWGAGGRGYRFIRDVEVKRSGEASGRINSIAPYDPSNPSFGTITQCFDAEGYSNREVSYSGFLKTENTTHEGAGLWLRADNKDDVFVAFDNMYVRCEMTGPNCATVPNDRRIRGTQEWTRANVEMTLPKGVVSICFGFLLKGEGTVWADDLELSRK